MSDDTQDDRMDAAIRAAAQSYNAPPATPRDEMWARIQARRVAPAPRRLESAGARWGWMSAAAAAVLLAGIGIGYALRGGPGREAASRPRMANVPPGVERPDTAASADGTRRQLATAGNTAGVGGADATSPASARSPGGTAHPGGAAEREQLVASAPRARRPLSSGAEPGDRADVGPDLAYRLAVVEHLARTEALLTSFRAEARSGTVDAQIGGWARDLLRTTRLMESSSETQDPTMRRLLGDLELVLVQIAQYSATTPGQARGEELDFIERSIDRRGVLGKLRAAIPPGMIPAGT